MKNRVPNFHIWGMITIPIAVLLIVVAGCFLDISTGSSISSSFSHTRFYSPDVSKTLVLLEIAPIIVLSFSGYLLIRQRKKIKLYRKFNPINYPIGIWRRIKTFIKYTLTLPKRFFIPQLAYYMLLFWSIGWGLYIYALWTNYESNSNVAELLGYSAMASLDLFLMDINGNILDAIGNTMKDVNVSLLKGSITIVAICAAFCSVFLVIKLFLFKLLSLYHTSHVKIKPTERNHLYIFWGINEKSLQLSESIKKNDKNRNLIIYIEHTSEREEDNDGINTIVNHLTSPSSKLSTIRLDDNTIYLSTTMELENVTKKTSIWSESRLFHLTLALFDNCLNKLYLSKHNLWNILELLCWVKLRNSFNQLLLTNIENSKHF